MDIMIIQDAEEISVLRQALKGVVIVSGMTVAEIEAMNRLRIRAGLPALPDIDSHFIQKYCNCFRGCE